MQTAKVGPTMLKPSQAAMLMLDENILIRTVLGALLLGVFRKHA